MRACSGACAAVPWSLIYRRLPIPQSADHVHARFASCRPTGGLTPKSGRFANATRVTPADTFGPFAKRARSEPGWRYFEIDASHAPNVTAPDALVALLQKIVAS